MAVTQGHVAAVERLVGHGAGLNVIACTGNTPLHDTMRLSNMTPPSDSTPEIKKVVAIVFFKAFIFPIGLPPLVCVITANSYF